MTGSYADGLFAGILLGAGLGLTLGLLVLPSIVDAWYAASRFIQRRQRRWHGR